MEYQFRSDTPEFKFRDEPSAPEKDTSLGGQAIKVAKDYGGAAMAAIDMAASLPGLVGAAGAAGRRGLDTSTGRSPTDVVSEVMQSANEGNPLNMLPENYTALRNTTGYEATNQLMGSAFSGIGQG